MSMTHGSNGIEDGTTPHRPPSAKSTHSSHSSGSSSKHVKCIGRYVLTGHTLGKGNFARVEAAVHTLTRAKVAIKIIETDKIKEEYVRKNLLREAQLMRRLRHPNIIRLYETMKTNNLYCLVTEIAEGGELLSFVRNDFKERRLPEATTRPFVRQLTSALFYLHSNGVVHRDLKMENILLDKKKRNVKIVDFGLSNAQKPGALLQTHCGSPEYAAPELFIPGRQYGPEVDVWSLGVNMYAMLVGKLPFRSPRQGTKKRQKLLEQISSGITEHHDKEMAHLSTGAHDLICHLLQPDSSRRATLSEVMCHTWITKDGTQLLTPYQYNPPDQITQNTVIELMQKVLGEPGGQIKETVRRDRCDWLASIYNLLMDQPEGRNVLQRMLTDDPSDQLVSAVEDYHSEHLSLSQGLSQSQHSQDVPDQDHLTGILTKPVFPSKHDCMKQRGPTNALVLQQDGEHGEYNSATLPLSKSERRRYHTGDEFTQLRGHGMYPSSAHHYQHHRLLIDTSSRHSHHYGNDVGIVSKRSTRGHHEDRYFHHGFNPPSGIPDPPPSRPHSRLSAPEPLPIPFQKSFLAKNDIYHHPNGSHNMSLTPTSSPQPWIEHQQTYTRDSSPLSNSTSSTKKRSTSGSLKPLIHKSLSTSVDTHLDAAVHGSLPWKGKVQVGPYRKSSMDGMMPPIGWSSQTQFSSYQRLASVGRSGPADIQSLMITDSPTTHHKVTTVNPTQQLTDSSSNIPLKSGDSMELKPELFLNSHNSGGNTRVSTSNSMRETTTEGLMIDILPLDNRQNPSLSRSDRSSSAKNPLNLLSIINKQLPEQSVSAKHLGEPTPVNGLRIQSMNPIHPPRELPSIDTLPTKDDKYSPSWKNKSLGGFIGKLKFKNGNTSKGMRTGPSGMSDV